MSDRIQDELNSAAERELQALRAEVGQVVAKMKRSVAEAKSEGRQADVLLGLLFAVSLFGIYVIGALKDRVDAAEQALSWRRSDGAASVTDGVRKYLSYCSAMSSLSSGESDS